MSGRCTEVFRALHGARESYYGRWYHDRPLAITGKRREELRELHRVLYKCAVCMAEQFEIWAPRFMPLPEREMELLRLQAAYPYRAGTYRPDHLLTEDGRLVLCEITSRFFAHGIFMSYFAERAADAWQEAHPGHERDSRFEEMLEYMLSLADGKDEIWVLKSADKTSEIGLYVPFYRHFGKVVRVVEADEVEATRDRWRRGLVLSALNQRDLMSFSKDTHCALLEAGMINDLRTVFLLHDKRFMRLWFEDAFTDACLTQEETAFLRAHAIPTWPWGCGEEHWERAREERSGYILKHHRLGKSEKVYAGPLTDEKTWRALWTSGEVRHMVLQPFLRQRTFSTVWEGQAFEDYICGMMLCVNDRYFDSGLFRASSLPVTNIGDDRKIAPVHTDDPALLSCADIL